MSFQEQYPLSVHNSLSRGKEVFESINKDYVGMYVCGPTVYGAPHLGHARGAITFDVVFRYLQKLDYKVRYVRNVTDVGHLEDEVAGAGEDKIAKKAKLEKLEPMEVVQTYTVMYHQAMDALNVLRPSIEPTATGHIQEQIKMIEKILANGYGYEKEGSVYFDMEKYTQDYDYGELSGKVLDDLISGSRALEGQDEKKSNVDFALWKSAKPEHLMKWDSPWGVGFPGWHLECTAMSAKYLGLPFDIHGGGMDLQFPHHEGEIAQSFGACGCKPVNYWLHNNMVTLDGQKMAKSKGNFITLDEMFSGNHELLQQGYSPMTIRFFMLQSHYRSPIDFSNEALQAAEKGFKKLMAALDTLSTLCHKVGDIDKVLDDEIIRLCDEVYKSMSDDFNTALALAALFELSSKIYSFYNKQLDITKITASTFALLTDTYSSVIKDVLGLKSEEDGGNDHLDGVMQMLIQMRQDARANKDFDLSDKIRDELAGVGVKLKDEKGITTYEVE